MDTDQCEICGRVKYPLGLRDIEYDKPFCHNCNSTKNIIQFIQIQLLRDLLKEIKLLREQTCKPKRKWLELKK